MIIRDRPGLLQVFITFRGSVIQKIYPQIFLVMALSVVVILAHKEAPTLVPTFNGAPFALLGVALSIFLGFRNNACYDRWWEARRHWGELLVTSRNLTRQSLLLEERGEAAKETRREILHLAIAFAHTLVDHLRQSGAAIPVDALIPQGEREAFAHCINRPAFILLAMGRILARLRADQILSANEWTWLDSCLDRMNGVQGACERLRNTPVPFGYTLLVMRTSYIFCFLVPFGFADVLGWTTPIASAVFAYTFFGLDALGDELEEPFSNSLNNLPIHSIAMTIEIGIREALGEEQLPQAPEPKNYILT